MRKCILFLGFVFLIGVAKAQTISADSIKFYEGKTVTVCEKIVDTHITTGESKTIFLNFGHPYPAQSFTGVIFQGSRASFSYDPVEFLKGKTVCVTGVVKIYKERPEIIINRPEQIVIK